MSSAFTDQLRVEREASLKEQQPTDHPEPHPALLQSNADYALARYRTLFSQMRELAALSDHAQISQRLAVISSHHFKGLTHLSQQLFVSGQKSADVWPF